MHRRFFLEPENFRGKEVFLPEECAHQLYRVFRVGAGERLIVLDNSGWEYEVEIVKLTSHEGVGRIVDKRKCLCEPPVIVNLYQSLLKGDKFDWVLQKGTEIGVSGFYPLLSLRCIVDRVSEAKEERWRRVIREAAEQSGRGKLPFFSQPIYFDQACQNLQGLSLIPWEGEGQLNLKQALSSDPPSCINLFIGPEGGFEEGEVEYARAQGIIPVTLGSRILRAETAALVAASLVIYHYGGFEGTQS